MRCLISTTIWLTAAALTCAAQPVRTPSPGDKVISPEVHSDGRVTFRLYAPQAREVTFSGALGVESSPKQPMTRDEDGIWSLTVGPLGPCTGTYQFTVDGVPVADPRNPAIKPAFRGPVSSLFLVPASPPAVWEPRPVPHGAVHAHWYRSPANDELRRFHVYTPPGYENGKGRFPVLYLLHGAGDTDAEWVGVGRANIVLDNLIAERKARPMIVVMPAGHISVPGEVRSPLGSFSAFEKDLLEGVIPAAEKLYRVTGRREQRALAGLSMGGGQTLNIGLRNLNRFSHLGVFSMGIRGEDFEKTHEAALANAERTNQALRLFWIACGERDFLWEAALKLDAVLSQHGIRHTFVKTPGGHVWMNWVKYLAEFSPLLFQ
ncbi:MAG: esterase [Bryobacterales bacterium]|nr:esterase [Bryobacterales bacterium]